MNIHVWEGSQGDLHTGSFFSLPLAQLIIHFYLALSLIIHFCLAVPILYLHPILRNLPKLFFQAFFFSCSRFWAHYCSNILQFLITQQSLLLVHSEIWWEHSPWSNKNTLLVLFILNFGSRRITEFWWESRGWELDPAEDFSAWFFPLKQLWIISSSPHSTAVHGTARRMHRNPKYPGVRHSGKAGREWEKWKDWMWGKCWDVCRCSFGSADPKSHWGAAGMSWGRGGASGGSELCVLCSFWGTGGTSWCVCPHPLQALGKGHWGKNHNSQLGVYCPCCAATRSV